MYLNYLLRSITSFILFHPRLMVCFSIRGHTYFLRKADAEATCIGDDTATPCSSQNIEGLHFYLSNHEILKV